MNVSNSGMTMNNLTCHGLLCSLFISFLGVLFYVLSHDVKALSW